MSVRVTQDVTSVAVNGTLYNLGPGIVYYSASPVVSASSNNGSLASGASAVLGGTQWLVSDSSAYVNAVAAPVVGASAAAAGTTVLRRTSSGISALAAGATVDHVLAWVDPTTGATSPLPIAANTSTQWVVLERLAGTFDGLTLRVLSYDANNVTVRVTNPTAVGAVATAGAGLAERGRISVAIGGV